MSTPEGPRRSLARERESASPASAPIAGPTDRADRWPAPSAVLAMAMDARRASADGIALLQRIAGNQAVTGLLAGSPAVVQRTPKGAAGAAKPLVQRRVEPTSDTDVPAGPADARPAPLTDAQRLSGAHWKQIADDRWGGATPALGELESSFGKDAQAFIDMLAANGITASVESAFRPPQRSYLFHWCTLLSKGKVKAADIPAMDGVDIVWDHGNEATSRSAAKALADAFGLVGVAAHPSNHNSGTAVDLKFDFSGNTSHTITYTVGSKTITRKIKVSGEPTVGSSAAGKSISDIGSRELSKAGGDFGLHRAVDNDIVHWSRSGR